MSLHGRRQMKMMLGSASPTMRLKYKYDYDSDEGFLLVGVSIMGRHSPLSFEIFQRYGDRIERLAIMRLECFESDRGRKPWNFI